MKGIVAPHVFCWVCGRMMVVESDLITRLAVATENPEMSVEAILGAQPVTEFQAEGPRFWLVSCRVSPCSNYGRRFKQPIQTVELEAM